VSGCLRGCASLLLILLVVGGAVWYWGPELPRFVTEWRATAEMVPETASPEVGEAARERFEHFLAGGSEEVRFVEAELESLLRWEIAEMLPDGIRDPEIRIRNGELSLGLRIARSLIPRIPELDAIQGFLPDTVPVQLRGRLITVDGGDAGFVVNRLEAASIPIPSRFIPPIAELVSPYAGGDLPPEIIRIPLPEGIRTVRIEGEELILTRS
jgi:hypothetical protein